MFDFRSIQLKSFNRKNELVYYTQTIGGNWSTRICNTRGIIIIIISQT